MHDNRVLNLLDIMYSFFGEHGLTSVGGQYGKLIFEDEPYILSQISSLQLHADVFLNYKFK